MTTVVEQHLADDVNGFLAAHGLRKDDIGALIAHSGGPKVIDAITKSLALPRRRSN